jgi:hypothetical protein
MSDAMKGRGLRSPWRFRAGGRGLGFHTAHLEEEVAPVERRYVAIALHRRRSVIVGLDSNGGRLGVYRIVNDRFELSAVMAWWGESPGVVIEASSGW